MPLRVDPNATEEFVFPSDEHLPDELQPRFHLKVPRERVRQRIEAMLMSDSKARDVRALCRTVIGECLSDWSWPVLADPEDEQSQVQHVEFTRDKHGKIDDEAYAQLRLGDRVALMERCMDLMGLKVESQD